VQTMNAPFPYRVSIGFVEEGTKSSFEVCSNLLNQLVHCGITHRTQSGLRPRLDQILFQNFRDDLVEESTWKNRFSLAYPLVLVGGEFILNILLFGLVDVLVPLPFILLLLDALALLLLLLFPR